MATKLIAKDYDLYKSDTRSGALSRRDAATVWCGSGMDLADAKSLTLLGTP
jgi:hypothetical protein